MKGVKNPIISVVMSVYNGSQHLAETLNSILTQENCQLEFIVVNDGSTDNSGELLDDWARKDSRLRIIHQNNTGLTQALIKACDEAKGQVIARQDVGDNSLPGRLEKQYEYLCEHPQAVMVTCGTQVIGPKNESLFNFIQNAEEVEQGLSKLDVKHIQGPSHHGSVMFRRSAYHRVGGYRLPFVVAQDIDLWLRLVEVGRCLGIPEIYYQARYEIGGISSNRRREQEQLCKLGIECAKIRRKHGKEQRICEQEFLDDFTLKRSKTRINSKSNFRRKRAEYYYFVGSCLRRSDKLAAINYFQKATLEDPFFLRAVVRRFLLKNVRSYF